MELLSTRCSPQQASQLFSLEHVLLNAAMAHIASHGCCRDGNALPLEHGCSMLLGEGKGWPMHFHSSIKFTPHTFKLNKFKFTLA